MIMLMLELHRCQYAILVQEGSAKRGLAIVP
jgi:hypothetical protein